MHFRWCCREENAVLVLSSSMTNINIATVTPVYLNFNSSEQFRSNMKALVMVAAQNINLEYPDNIKIRALEQVTEGMGGGKVKES